MAKGKGAELARKLTITTVTGGAKKWFTKLMEVPGEDKAIELMTIAGFANGWKPYASEFGEGVTFLGQFRAINAEDGVISTAGQCILPTYISDSLKAALDMPGRQGPISFGFDIAVRFDASAGTKYVYVIRNVVETTQDDPLERLWKQVTAKETETPKLEAPAPEVETVKAAPAKHAKR